MLSFGCCCCCGRPGRLQTYSIRTFYTADLRRCFILDSLPAPSPKPNRTFQYKRKNRRASRASFFLIGLRQVKVVRDDACLTYNYSMIKTGGCTVFDDSSWTRWTPYTHWVWPAGLTNPTQQWCTLSLRFPNLRGGIDPGDLRFRPRVVGVVKI